jgi:hypothetical protein
MKKHSVLKYFCTVLREKSFGSQPATTLGRCIEAAGIVVSATGAERKPTAESKDTVDLPAAEKSIRRPVQVRKILLTSPEGNFIYGTEGEAVLDVKVRQTPLATDAAAVDRRTGARGRGIERAAESVGGKKRNTIGEASLQLRLKRVVA